MAQIGEAPMEGKELEGLEMQEEMVEAVLKSKPLETPVKERLARQVSPSQEEERK